MSCFRAPHPRPQGATSPDDVDSVVLAAAIAEAHRVGHARAPHVLRAPICRRLLQELRPLPWEELPVNEATFMAYDWPDGGISPHRDGARYRGAVIVFTVEGTAPFRIHHSRDIEDVVASWLTTPGDMVVLRSAAAGGVEGRAMHSVGPPLRGARVSLSFRNDSTRERSTGSPASAARAPSQPDPIAT